MSLKSIPSRMMQLFRTNKLALIVGIVLLFGGIAWSVRIYNRHRYFDQLAKELHSEEEDEEHFLAKRQNAADDYVNDFMYATTIEVSNLGFTPSIVSVKPQTKLIFKAIDEGRHLIAVAPGGNVPKYFDSKVEVTEHTVLQTKVEQKGSYTFYDTYYPHTSVTVYVVE